MVIAWMVIKVEFISLVNLIMDSEVIKELVQYDLTEKKLLPELKSVLKGGEAREKVLNSYKDLRIKLGPAGASGRIAADMVKTLKSR
jgi:lipid-A-disaccharide synthase